MFYLIENDRRRMIALIFFLCSMGVMSCFLGLAILMCMILKKLAPETYRKHISVEFPKTLPPECFSCNEPSCIKCGKAKSSTFDHCGLAFYPKVQTPKKQFTENLVA